MDGTIDVFGKPVKKTTAAIAGIGVAVLGIGVYRYRKQQAADAAATAAQNAATAPGTGAGSSDATDPATGFPYGSPEDAAALAAQGGYNGVGYYGPGGGTVAVPGGYYPPSGTTGFTSNPQWAQAAENYLVQNTQASADVVGNALGKYITGGVLTADQMSIVDQAIAFEGIPPVPGPDGFPPGERTAPATPPPGGGGGGGGSGGGSGGGGGGTVKKPTASPGGMSQTQHGTFTDFGWGKVNGATSYDFQLDSKVIPETGDHAERVPVGKGSHKWRARGRNSAGAGPWSPFRSFTVR